MITIGTGSQPAPIPPAQLLRSVRKRSNSFRPIVVASGKTVLIADAVARVYPTPPPKAVPRHSARAHMRTVVGLAVNSGALSCTGLKPKREAVRSCSVSRFDCGERGHSDRSNEEPQTCECLHCLPPKFLIGPSISSERRYHKYAKNLRPAHDRPRPAEGHAGWQRGAGQERRPSRRRGARRLCQPELGGTIWLWRFRP